MPADSFFQRRNIVCFSTADWDTLLPTNKHHLARNMAARGARVLFIETLGTRAPRMESGTDWRRIIRRLGRAAQGVRRREPRIHTLSPVVRPRWSSRNDIAMNRALFRIQAAGAAARYRDAIAWVYSPYASHLLDVFQPRHVVYHMVDDLAAVPGADRGAIREAEARLLATADLVICSERSLFDRARTVTPRCRFLPNVADFAHFSRVPSPPPTDARLARLRALPSPRILFSGNLAPHKVDFQLLDDLARLRPAWSIILVGPRWEGARDAAVMERLFARPNVYTTGHVLYGELPAYLHAADVLLIPYVLNDATRAVFPLKLFEYLATGRPVVAGPLPSVLPYRGAIRIADGAEEWVAEIEAALGDSHEMERQRRALARRHTWAERMKEIEAELCKL